MQSHTLSPCKSLALDAYRIATRSWRERIAARQAAAGKARVMSFFYHRVAKTADSPWTISFDTFRRQIDFFRERFEMVSLENSLRRIADGNYAPTAHITFDDGYADNCSEALPYLIANRVPTTYFVASQHVLQGKPFAHDVSLGKPMTVNTPSQIRAMADAGVEIGAHTRHHVDCGEITDLATLRDEIDGSKQELEDLIGRPVRYFAFPYGTRKQLTAAAIGIARESGFEAICSAVGGYNFPGDDPFHLQRIHGDVEMARFKNWATLDPRKLRMRLRLPINLQPVPGKLGR